MAVEGQNYWKKCSICKAEIPFAGKYYLCSVSTCRHKRTGFRFCSVACWDAHLGYANHRSSFAEEVFAPSREEFLKHQNEIEEDKMETGPMDKTTEAPANEASRDESASEILVVVSKVKRFIREQSGMNTSQCCVDALTKKIVSECKQAIERARSQGRKTVMGRDIA